ncbi:trypsin-like peptidase domain-containing protein [bacterium]|nr:trypsin-like peptidase domain-containing protein [bacterium]
MKTRKLSKVWIVVAILALTLTACSLPNYIVGLLSESVNQTAEPDTVVVQEATPIASEPNIDTPSYVIPDEVLQQDALVNIYQSVSPGVVSIQVLTEGGGGVGSGFVVDKEGHIVTNYHVVEGATSVEVDFQSGLKVFGEVLAVDIDSDIAVVKVDVDPGELYPLAIGDSDQVHVGQTVVAIGNPYGLTGTMTVGIVSARGRTLDSIRQTSSGNYFSAGDLIQTDATINPGNSGGPLLNLNGEVIGINRAIQTTGTTLQGNAVNTGIGFAVSSNILKLVLPSLVNGESYNYPYLGLSALPTLTLTEAELFGLDQATGAYVLQVVPGGPSDQAGIRAGDEPTQYPGYTAGGDLLVGVDGQEVLQFSDLLSYMMLNKQPGDTMTVTVLRDGETLDLTVTLGERPANGE